MNNPETAAFEARVDGLLTAMLAKHDLPEADEAIREAFKQGYGHGLMDGIQEGHDIACQGLIAAAGQGSDE